MSARSLRASAAAALARGPHVGRLFAQPIDFDRQQTHLLRAGGNAVELTRPQVGELTEGALRLLRRCLSRSCVRYTDQQQQEQGEAS